MILFRLSVVMSIITVLNVFAIEAKPKIQKEIYGKTIEGKTVEQFTLTNSSGAEAKIITFGGIITSLKVPDKNGKLGQVVLGYDNLQGYENDSFYIGALIGRYANRIGKGQFTLNGKTYNLAKNNGENNLHGGPKGYQKVVWNGRSFVDKTGATLEMQYFSKDGEEGFPANLKIKVIYTLTEKNELKVDYFATTDGDTIVNLTQHSYFNLAGSGDILSHQLQINSSKYTPTDQGAIPTGEFKGVKGTPFDFSSLTEIGKGINNQDEQLIFGKGYDHNWVLNKKGKELSIAAKVAEK
ncbi:MAG: aldose epimerase family protein, partial [Acidobacteriota bacterium]